MSVCKCGATITRRFAKWCDPCGASRRRKKVKYHPTPEIDALIREAWLDEPLYCKAAGLWVQERMPAPKWPLWEIKRRAISLGVSRLRHKEPDWSVEELAILDRTAWMGEDRVVIHLKRAGFRRTKTAVHLKRKRLRLLSNLDGYSATRLAELLGEDSHKIVRWIKFGWLKAERRGTNRTESQGGDTYYIAHSRVREFVLTHPEEIELGKADKLWLLDLLTDGRIGMREGVA